MIAVCVDPKRIYSVWPHFRHFIKQAVDEIDLVPFEERESAVLKGRALLWLAYDGEKVIAAATTELFGDMMEISACGGSGLKQFLSLLQRLEQFAMDEGCKFVRVAGRAGWQRILKDYKVRSVIIEKTL